MRLSSETIDRLPRDVARPAYDRAQVRAGVVHLGIGAFHRAHQAVVFDDLLAAGDLRWGVRGASLRSPGVRDSLAPQDGLYTLLVRDGDEERARIIGAVGDVLVLPEDPAALIGALANPDTHLVTLTVTEKGYRLDPASGELLSGDPDVAADIAGEGAPRTVPGLLVAALAERRARGLPAFTAISCDNLAHNGRKLEAAVLAMAAARDPALRDWIAEAARFPQTMVDRIVPATSAVDIAALAGGLGVTDAAMVKTEPFSQWVIEDRFAGERPDFAGAGVQLTDDVAPWEEAKLRLLNGAHSTIAYLGGLAGIETVDQVVARPGGRALVEALWDEAETTLSPPPGLDIAAYRRALMARFANSALAHRTRQIAMDGSQKLPQRLVATAAARIAAGRPIDTLALAIAGWMRWQAGRTDAGAAFVVDDPLAARTAARIAGRETSSGQVDALLGLEAVFPADLAADPRFREPVAVAHRRLAEKGAAALLA
ncbi:mannitol dehydrogenase family protein [Sphingomonas gilva]|uniref:Mannitol dehydrogenase family protein n=1 Tax=Sphingomonas gilva TaxID=2305907 RepID=A0A396RRF0_9SPHN|nr:mannitol dehydrogenase family protein [Sphingomonas gilva]RHW18596.1 mannitol dehydrogenase family protein [Sphingomonas gilva]